MRRYVCDGDGGVDGEKESSRRPKAPAESILDGPGLGVNGVYWTGIRTCSAVNAGIGRDNPFVAGFTDGINRAGFVAGTAVDALVANGMSQGIHLLFVDFQLVV